MLMIDARILAAAVQLAAWQIATAAAARLGLLGEHQLADQLRQAAAWRLVHGCPFDAVDPS